MEQRHERKNALAEGVLFVHGVPQIGVKAEGSGLFGRDRRLGAPRWGASMCKENALCEHDALSSHGLHRSTFGEERLNYRVRNGVG